MLKEKIDTIIEAEDKAAAFINKANTDAKKIILDSENDAEKIAVDSMTFAKQNLKIKIEEGVNAGELASKDIIENGLKKAAKLKSDAKKNIDKAVAEILGRIFSEWQ